MISYQEAQDLICSVAKPLPSEEVPFQSAVGRILSESVIAKEMLPPFANSAMDGFAYRLSDLKGNPTKLKVLGTIAAGDSAEQKLFTGTGETWEIMTGAPLPCDCDSVIKVEDTKREGSWVEFSKCGKLGENVRIAGEDVRIGDLIARQGTKVFPEHLMAFAALGVEKVNVLRVPTVSVLSTGAELAMGKILTSGQIRNSTGPYLTAELSKLGTQTGFLGTIADDPAHFLKVIKANVEKGADIILSTGAVSMGKYDFVAAALKDLGAEILFHKVAIRPGKPLLFAKLGGTAFFGVPGNPISSAVALRFFVEPYLRAIQRLPAERAIRMTVDDSIKKPEGLRCFFKARSRHEGGTAKIEILKGQESFKIAPILDANSWAVLPEDGREIGKGSEIDVFPLHSWAPKEEVV